ncbi:MAG TPA: uracil-DNA glycosylase [Gammaproteobacteria bacterium]|nr:uracil-DNA glycosylase [Gammaproteobacteria bacterium]
MTAHHAFNMEVADSSWHDCLKQALDKMDPDYLAGLQKSTDWLPGHANIFNAFTLPLHRTHHVLFGESPYPREISANGYAFWDAAVDELWSETGLSKRVNRATSLRNIIKMLLVADGRLNPDKTTQADIAELCKKDLVKTNHALFTNFLAQGFLLLNATPVLRPNQMQKDARAWHPFIRHVLHFIFEARPDTRLILLGNIANAIEKLLGETKARRLKAEHPYNLSFIQNPEIIDFFRPLHLMQFDRTFAISQ